MITSLMSHGPGVRVRQWGWQTYALNVDDRWVGTFTYREEAQQQGERILKSVATQRR